MKGSMTDPSGGGASEYLSGGGEYGHTGTPVGETPARTTHLHHTHTHARAYTRVRARRCESNTGDGDAVSGPARGNLLAVTLCQRL